ncbi:MAG: hypothetical protein KDB08_02100 [Microthrixaceae bacterium]|nr:hypothetical protein [Microthrixaceae bacterium]
MVLNATTAINVDSPPAPRQDTLELVLQDRERVTAQFAAIMTASGFGDRVILETLPGPPHHCVSQAWGGNPRWRFLARLPATRVGSRVRSPPDRS